MNSYPGQPPPPHSLHDKPAALSMARQSEYGLGSFAPNVDHLAPHVELSTATLSPQYDRSAMQILTGQYGHDHESCSPISDRLASQARPFRFTYLKQVAMYNAQFFHAPQQHYPFSPMAHQSHNKPPPMHGAKYFLAPRELERFTSHHTRVPNAANNCPWPEGRHNDTRPPEPHIPRVSGLPPATMDKVR